MAFLSAPLTFLLSGLVMLAGSAGIGIPLGTPPTPEQPAMLQVAPEECLYFIHWSGRAEASAKSVNNAERLLADKEIQQFGTQVLGILRQSMIDLAGDNQTAEAKVIRELVPLLAETILAGPGTIYVSEAKLVEAGVAVDGGIVLSAGKEGLRLNELLTQFAGTVLQRPAAEVKVAGKEFRVLELGGGIPQITWGIVDEKLMVAVGDLAMEGMLARLKTPAPKWLTQTMTRWSIKRRSTIAYADLAAIRSRLSVIFAKERVQEILDQIGVGNLEAYYSVTGFDERLFVSHAAITFDGKLQGVLGLLEAPKLTETDFANFPADTLAALLLQADGKKVFEDVLLLLKMALEQDYQRFQQDLAALEKTIGVQLGEDFLAALGKRWQVYTAPDTGGWLTGWLLAVDVTDHVEMSKLQARMMQQIEEKMASATHQNLQGFSRSSFRGQEIMTWTSNLTSVSAVITKKQLLVSLYPQAIKAHLRRTAVNAQKMSLSSNSRLQQLFKGQQGPQFVQYVDTGDLLRTVYPMLQVGARQFLVQLQENGMDINIVSLPSLDRLLKHVQPSLTSIHRVPDGVEVRSSQTIPSNSLSISAPVAIALLLPAVNAARESARRVAGMNNLKQIGVAMHNFHDSYSGFPAAYSADKNGKPLLSWRVHILPFIGGQALYRQFKLDEPWDSPHNKKLIARMPAVYQAAGSRNSPGKTNYQAVRVGQTVMKLPPRAMWGKKVPVGTSFREITDGTSNTAMVVETSDVKAVTWTKPDDLVPDVKDPAKGIRGLRRNGFLLLHADGSVRFLADRVDPRVLKALFTRNGGEAFGNNELR